jgi:hypothetical protein
LHPRQPSADDLLEAIRAEAVLTAMDAHEDLAALATSETNEMIHREFADRYRSLIGVFPHERELLRQGLEHVRDGGGMAVADLIDAIRRDTHSALHSEK